MTPPVLLLVFNRPETTSRVFEAIRTARPTRLYVAADGPRSGRRGDIERCAEVRRIATAVDWPCEIHTLFRNTNLGCKSAVISAVTWFFEHESEGIILEDDVFAGEAFFEFVAYALEKYRSDVSIGSISGFNIVPRTHGKTGHFVSRYAQVWGWATWVDRWNDFCVFLPITGQDISLLDKFRWWEKRRWQRVLADAESSNSIWDYQWQYFCLSFGKKAVRATESLTINIGFDNNATHTFTLDKYTNLIKLTPKQGSLFFPRINTIPWEDELFYIYKYCGGWKKFFGSILRGHLSQKLWIRLDNFVIHLIRLLNSFKPLPIHCVVPRNLVVSPGGVATTTLMHHISQYVEINSPDDKDGFKHLPIPVKAISKNTRVLFIYGDLNLSFESLDRRGFVDKQAVKLRSPMTLLARGSARSYFLKRAIQRQYNIWRKAKDEDGLDILFIRYDDIWRRIDDIKHFFEIDETSFIENFPLRRKRLSTRPDRNA